MGHFLDSGLDPMPEQYPFIEHLAPILAGRLLPLWQHIRVGSLTSDNARCHYYINSSGKGLLFVYSLSYYWKGEGGTVGR